MNANENLDVPKKVDKEISNKDLNEPKGNDRDTLRNIIKEITNET